MDSTDGGGEVDSISGRVTIRRSLSNQNDYP